MRYPGYLLNPGDMFQVEMDRVLYAMGQEKVRNKKITEEDQSSSTPEEDPSGETSAEATDASAVSAEAVDSQTPTPEQDPKEALKELRAEVKDILEQPQQSLSGKQKQSLRALSQAVRKLLS
jgi:hypothetical protein